MKNEACTLYMRRTYVLHILINKQILNLCLRDYSHQKAGSPFYTFTLIQTKGISHHHGELVRHTNSMILNG